jgi:hypothetical protein
MIVSPTVVEEEDGDAQLGVGHTFSDVCARVVKIFHLSIPKIPTSRGVETVTTVVEEEDGDAQLGVGNTFGKVKSLFTTWPTFLVPLEAVLDGLKMRKIN